MNIEKLEKQIAALQRKIGRAKLNAAEKRLIAAGCAADGMGITADDCVEYIRLLPDDEWYGLRRTARWNHCTMIEIVRREFTHEWYELPPQEYISPDFRTMRSA